jgi:hypothetical protein
MNTDTKDTKEPRFATGQLVATPRAMDKLSPAAMASALARHVTGDWGDVDDEDRAANDADVIAGGRLLSTYPIPDEPDEKFWIITEADRSATTFLLPEEY